MARSKGLRRPGDGLVTLANLLIFLVIGTPWILMVAG
jgi:hypothetical protein